MLIPLTMQLALLPALSIAVPVTDWLAPSVPTAVDGVTEATPERLSLAAKLTITLALFQPLVLGSGLREPVIVGGVLSILNEDVVEVVLLPALSVTVTVLVTAEPSAVNTMELADELVLAMPDRLSLVVKGTETSVLFQPSVLGDGVAVPKDSVGGVLSILMLFTVSEALLPALSVTVPVVDCPAPSTDKVTSGETVSTPERVSVAVKCTVTSLLFQPLLLGEGLHEALIVGGVLSRLTTGEVKVSLLPALSVTVTVWVSLAPSVVKVNGLVGLLEATPDKLSLVV